MLVTSPTLPGNWDLIIAGITTLPIAMPIPMTAVPMNSPAALGQERTTSPIKMKISPSIIVMELPSLWQIFATNGETTAKVIRGIVVMIPATASDRLYSLWIIFTMVPTAVIGARRLKEMNNIPKIRSTASVIFIFGLCCLSSVCMKIKPPNYISMIFFI